MNYDSCTLYNYMWKISVAFRPVGIESGLWGKWMVKGSGISVGVELHFGNKRQECGVGKTLF